MRYTASRLGRCGLGLLLALCAAAASPAAAVAQPAANPHAPAGPAAPAPAADKADAAHLFPPDAVSQHVLAVGDKRLAYTATAGTLPLVGPKGAVSAHIFFVAYTLDAKAADRPVTFVFNGGPGAASAFLHLGALGPRAVNFSANGAAAVQPVALADNPDAWLDFTDLVFVDPVATGFSRSAAGTDEADKAFFGVEKDADAMADFVRLYLTRAGRSLASVFLAGESYGGFRVALLANRLIGSGMAVKGVVMISPALEFSMLRGDRYVPLPAALALPSIAATHLERRDGPAGSLEILPEVERFARSGYLVHLAAGVKGNAEIDRTLARYTGLPATPIRDHNSRVTVRTFTHEYEKGGDRVLSRYDATVTAPVPRRSEIRFDPILDGAVSVLTPAFTQYARGRAGLSHRPRILPAQPRGQRPLGLRHLLDATGVRRRARRAADRTHALPGAGRAHRPRLHRPGHALRGLAVPDRPAGAARGSAAGRAQGLPRRPHDVPAAHLAQRTDPGCPRLLSQRPEGAVTPLASVEPASRRLRPSTTRVAPQWRACRTAAMPIIPAPGNGEGWTCATNR